MCVQRRENLQTFLRFTAERRHHFGAERAQLTCNLLTTLLRYNTLTAVHKFRRSTQRVITAVSVETH